MIYINNMKKLVKYIYCISKIQCVYAIATTQLIPMSHISNAQ